MCEAVCHVIYDFFEDVFAKLSSYIVSRLIGFLSSIIC